MGEPQAAGSLNLSSNPNISRPRHLYTPGGLQSSNGPPIGVLPLPPGPGSSLNHNVLSPPPNFAPSVSADPSPGAQSEQHFIRAPHFYGGPPLHSGLPSLGVCSQKLDNVSLNAPRDFGDSNLETGALRANNSGSIFGGHWSTSSILSTGSSLGTSRNSLSGGSHSAGNLSAAIDGRRKEKTPMCQIAELARYNKLCHEYRLLNESGPAHQKTFTVVLSLREGDEYTGEGPSIKKAQQEAAKRALELTQLPTPNNKARWRQYNTPQVEQTLTPTVLLNAVAHDKGMVPVYKTLVSPPSNRNYRPHIPRGSRFSSPYQPHVVMLRLGTMDFVGQGVNKQMARHNCAAQALNVLNRHITGPLLGPQHPLAMQSPAVAAGECQTCASRGEAEECGKEHLEAELEKQLKTKSPISLVHEMALQKKMDVTFEILSEVGPAHNRNYVVSCVLKNVVERIIAEGQGGSKKQAKHSACKEMIDLLRQNGPLPVPGTVLPRKPRQPKESRRKTIVKDVKIDPDYGQQINPISRLIQIQQARKEPEPNFVFISESGQARSKEFLMQVTIGDNSCRGTGPNKKLAKRAASETMLTLLGYAKPLPKPGKSVLKQSSIQSNTSDRDGSELPETCGDAPTEDGEAIGAENGDCSGGEVVGEEVGDARDESEERRVSISEEALKDTNNECQETPKPKRKVSFKLDCEGGSEWSGKDTPGSPHTGLISGVGFMPPMRKSRNPVPHNEQMASLGKQLLAGLMGQPTTSTECAGDSQEDNGECMNAKQRLQYLAGACGFRIEFTDFPKTVREDGSSDYLTLVSLGISPPHVCNGVGPTVEMAQNEAATAALRALAESRPLPPAPEPAPPRVRVVSRGVGGELQGGPPESGSEPVDVPVENGRTSQEATAENLADNEQGQGLGNDGMNAKET